MMAQPSQKKRRERVPKAKPKPGLGSDLPRRMTSCIFPRPVTRVTSHPGNEVRRRPWEEKLEKPQQVCAYRRLQGLQACNSVGEILNTLDFENVLKTIAPGDPVESLGCAGAEGPRTCPEPTPVQSSNMAEIIPGVGLRLSPPLHEQQVTYADIRRQTRKVKKARKRLAMALRADRLVREAEKARRQEGRPES
ncbi:putative methyl-CpG-binding domain protein 3-like 3 [Loxodonta africana]|uniref:putative methyl-CpG-binding domain protein 3-like 3 n=1 Tax=Loxodonta africana TaxID=9785 RepID=UPI000C8122F6|nr:putative methyl-CpG-binding domain protein 3-like 3 [Loxodonta africana]